jgi:hypothetical protein
MDMTQVLGITTVGAGVLTAAAMVAGVVDRTGPTGGYTDTLDSAANLMKAIPGASVGDSFEFWFRNTVAQACTIAVGVGAELSGSNTAVGASLTRRFLVTILATNAPAILVATTVSGSAAVGALTAEQAQLLQPGMGVSGSGINSGTTVIGVNASTGAVTLSANATASASGVSLTFFPRYNIKGLIAAAI